MSDNMALWKQVSVTDPAMAKDTTNGRFRFTSVDPQYQVQQATKLWGPYGERWGLFNLEFAMLQHDPPMLMLSAVFRYPGQDGKTVEFPIAVDLKPRPGDDVCKKLITSARSKALSFLGFNADVFLGKFEDAAYVKDLKIRFEGQNAFTKKALSKIRSAADKQALDLMRDRVDELVAAENITGEQGADLHAEIDQREAEL